MAEENQNQQNMTKKNPVSAEPKQAVVENIEHTSPIKKMPISNKTPTKEQPTKPEDEQIKTQTKPATIENPDGIKQTEVSKDTEPPKVKTAEEIPQTEEIPGVKKVTENQSESIKQTKSEAQTTPQPQQPQIVEKIIYQTPPNLIQKLLHKARAKIQERKNKKLDKIMSLFNSNLNISNSNVQKLLRTTKRSATRYLDILEKQQKIIQIGRSGRGVKYIKKP